MTRQEVPLSSESINIIAIGASAGGLEALQDFLSTIPELKNTAILIAQHLSPTHKSMLVHLLSKETALTVEEAKSGLALAPNTVYITPPDNEISIGKDLKIHLQKPHSNVGPKPSVDVLFDSLQYLPQQHKIVAIILSGTGSDGAQGIRSLKHREVLTIAQDPNTAKYDGMPSAAIQTGLIDLTLKTPIMGQAIWDYFQGKHIIPSSEVETGIIADDSLSKILELLGKRTGTDFSNYKSATISRRLEKRMTQLRIHDIKDYLNLVEKKPHELDDMFNMILIGVTTFFRDKESFEALEKELTSYLEKKNFKDQIRIWVPGCSTGEEAYSIAIILSQIFKGQAHNYNIQIFATDIDDRAIIAARKGLYSEDSIKPIPQNLLEKFFIRKGNEYELVKAIRSMVLFSKHDVINNPPFLKMDLISCRNLLIYFNNALQQQVLPIFHYSLNPEGILFLGKSETVGQFTDLFSTIDSKNKLFRRRRGGGIHQVKFASFKSIKQELPQEKKPLVKKTLSLSEAIRETIFKTFEYPYVVINESYDIQEVNGDVRLFMSLSPGNIQVNLLKMVNQELQIELRAVLTKTFREKSAVSSHIKKFHLFGKDYFVRITAKPLFNAELYEDMYLVIFQRLELEEFIQNSSFGNNESAQNSRIVELEHELAATKEHLQTYIEEIETANEELQSLNEEMQSTNEELQSSNEELETSNEELQSTNEEIQIAYSELKAAHEELEKKETLLKISQANSYSLLNNNLQGLLLIDSSYRVIELNQQAQRIFYDIKGDNIFVHDSFIDFLPLGQLDEFITQLKKCSSGQVCTLDIQLVDFKHIIRNYTFNFSPVLVDSTTVSGISIGILETTAIKNALSELNVSERLINSVFTATTTGICITDSQGRFVDVNQAYCELCGYTKEELIGQKFTMVVQPRLRKELERMHEDFIKHGKELPMDFDVVNKSGRILKVSSSADLLIQPDGQRYKVTSVRDITRERNLQMLISEALQISQLGAWELDPQSKLMEMTPLFKKIFSVSPNEPMNLPDFLAHFRGKKNQDKISKSILRCITAGETFDLEVPINNPEMEEQWIRIIGKAERSDNKTIRIFGSIQDISKGKLLELQLASINKNLPGALMRLALTKSGEQKILYLSEGARSLWGVDPSDAIQDNSLIWGKIDDEEKIAIKASLKASAEMLSPWTKVWSFKDAEARITWNKGSGNPFRTEDGTVVWDIVVLDISEEFQTKALLEETEKRFEYLFEQVDSLAVQGYDKTGKVKYWNSASEKLYGYTREEAIGKYLWDLIIPEEIIPIVKTNVYNMVTQGDFISSEELPTKHKSGELIPVYSNHTLIQLPGKDLEIFCIDISLKDQKKAEIQLQESKALLVEAQKIAKMGNWNFDFRNDSLTWSEGLYEVFDADRETFLETHGSFINLVHESHREFVLHTSQHTQKTGEPFTIQYPITTPLGREKIIEEHGYAEKDQEGNIIRLYGTAQDVTAQVTYEEKLKLANQRYEYATQATADIIFDFKIDQQIITWGKNAEIIFGEAIHEMEFVSTASEFLELISDQKSMVDSVKAVIRDKKSTLWNSEQQIRLANDKIADFSIKAFLLRTESGHAYRAIGALQDISKQRLTETRTNILNEIRSIFNSNLPITESLEEALKVICSAVNLEMGELWTTTIDQKSINLIAKYASNDAIVEFFNTSSHITSFQKGQGFAGNVWNDNEIQVWTDIDKHIQFVRKTQAKQAGIHMVLGVPLSINEHVIGVLIFGSQGSGESMSFLKDILTELQSSLSAELLRKKIENELQEIFEATPDIICLSGYDGYFKKINPAACKILGYTEEELLSRPFLEFTHPDDRPKTGDELMSLVEGKETFYFENRYVTKSGQTVWLSWSSRSNPSEQLIYAVAKNITEQKKLQKTLDAATVLAQMGGWEIDLRSEDVILTQTALEIYELPENYDVKKDLVEDFFLEPYKSEFKTAFFKCLENGEAFEQESKIRGYSGKEKWIRIIGKPEYENGVPIKIIGSTQDITTIKNFEESLKLLNENLREQSKRLAMSNADLEQFAYVASHDLQEPLRMVSNFMSLLDKKYGDQLDGKAKEYIDYAIEGAKKMRSIILGLLEFSRAGRYPDALETVNINEVVDEVLKLQGKLIEEANATIEIGTLPIISALRLPMIQVFSNLINNSLKYMDPNRPIIINISAEEFPQEWIFKVSDNGQGIPKEYLDKIFIIFQRVIQNGRQNGSGLGLAIVKKIIEKFGGSIWVESEVGKGSSFFFSVPKQGGVSSGQ
ncbi:MAG: PAS domain S-box protein [Mongoliitalea sp.]